MKKIIIPLLTTVISFFILFLIFLYDLIPKYVFTIITKENPRLILSGNLGSFYIYGIILVAILIGWKVLQKLDHRIKNRVRAFNINIHQKFLLLIAIILIIISFKQFYIFTDNKIYQININLNPKLISVSYDDIESIRVFADFMKMPSGKTAPTCQLYTDVSILSKTLSFANKSLTRSDVYDLGSILKEKNITTDVEYSNNCNHIPDYQKDVIQNSFNVKIVN